MRKPQTNYAFIDGNNLHISVINQGWKLNFRKFRIYLKEKFAISVAYYFIGRIEENQPLYDYLTDCGYKLIFKPTFPDREGEIKGNIDANLVLQAMIDWDKYDKAVIVTSDGDFYCLIKHWREHNKLLRVISSSQEGCSCLIKQEADSKISYIEELRNRLEYHNN